MMRPSDHWSFNWTATLKRLSRPKTPPRLVTAPLAIPAIAALVAVAFLLLPGCGSSSSSSDEETTTIRFLTMQLRPTFDDYFNGLIADFEASHPGVKIQWLDYPFQNYETKLMTSLMGSTPPDVINLSSQTLPTWVEAGAIQPVTDIVPAGALDRFVPNAVEKGCAVDGKVYALPWYMTSVVTMINKSIIKEAGLTMDDVPRYFDDVPAFAREIKDKTGKFGYFPLYTEGGAMRGWLIDACVPLTDKDWTRAEFDTPRAVEIVKMWTDMYRDGLVPSEALTAMHRRPIELYKTGRLALLHSGTEFLRQIKSDAPDVYENTVIRPQLQWKGCDSHPLAFHVISVAAKSKHPKLAGEFAAFLTNAKNQLEFCKRTTILPSVVEALKNPYFTDPGDSREGLARKYAAEQVMKGKVIRLPRQNAKKLNKVMDDIVENICLGKLSAKDGVKKAAEEWDRILAGGEN